MSKLDDILITEFDAKHTGSVVDKVWQGDGKEQLVTLIFDLMEEVDNENHGSLKTEAERKAFYLFKSAFREVIEKQ